MHLLSRPKKPTTSNSLLLRLPTHALSLLTRWLSVTHVMVSTWLAVCSTVVMLFQRMSIQLLPQSRPRGLSSLWTGAQLVSRFVFEYTIRLISPGIKLLIKRAFIRLTTFINYDSRVVHELKITHITTTVL